MLWLVLITLAIKGIGASLINTLMFGLEADTVEYGEWKTGKRSEGATYALFSFTRKVTQSIGGAVGAWALAIGGYIAASAANPSPVQPDSAIFAIKATIGLLPAVAALIAMIIFIKYPLTDDAVQADPRRDRGPQAGRHRGAPRGPRVVHHARPQGLSHRPPRPPPTARAEMSKPDLTAAPVRAGRGRHRLGPRHHRRHDRATRRSASCSSTSTTGSTTPSSNGSSTATTPAGCATTTPTRPASRPTSGTRRVAVDGAAAGGLEHRGRRQRRLHRRHPRRDPAADRLHPRHRRGVRRWAWSAAGSRGRWAATGPSPRSSTSTTTGATPWSPPGPSATTTRR